jgi:heme/copper-type cytochrome/quinol oxidase subunit 2
MRTTTKTRGQSTPAIRRKSPKVRNPDLDGFVEQEEGAVYLEYITIVITMGIVIALAVISLGVPLLNTFRMTQVFLGAPVP